MSGNRRLSVLWTKHLSSDQNKEDFVAAIANSTVALGRLCELITEFETEINSKELSLEEYDSPSWAYKQAHLNGQRSAYKKLKTILKEFN